MLSLRLPVNSRLLVVEFQEGKCSKEIFDCTGLVSLNPVMFKG